MELQRADKPKLGDTDPAKNQNEHTNAKACSSTPAHSMKNWQTSTVRVYAGHACSCYKGKERKEQHLTHAQTLKPGHQPIKERTKESLREVRLEICEERPQPDLGTGVCMKRSAVCRRQRKLRSSTEALIFCWQAPMPIATKKLKAHEGKCGETKPNALYVLPLPKQIKLKWRRGN